MAKVAPSILAADFANLGADIADVCRAGADYLHIDVMDGAFVPNISFGSAVMKSLNRYATVPYDVHLMVMEPIRYIKDFITDNTDFITVHIEACADPAGTIDAIHALGIKAGISLNPETDVSALEPVLDMVELVLVMSVHPGFGGQKFIPVALDKIRYLAAYREEHGLPYVIEVDGGVGSGNAALVREAGVDLIVAGSAVFKAADRVAEIAAIRG
ncbi:MAG: ribulose-phosphate 3-epimerase [Mogibacterium sp.]|nr:ribulose-phosphate 3-epimerase [Mogibacterium sp.]